MLTITRKDLLLTINDNVIPAMGSSDVPVKFVNDTETYVGFLIEPRVGYYVNGCPKSTVCEYDISSNTIKIPAEAFKNKGILVIAIALIDNADSNHIEVTKELALEVTPAPNGTVILPATDTWQTAVKNLVEQLYNQDYKPQFDQIQQDLENLVTEAQQQQQTAEQQQTQIDNAISVMGEYQIVSNDPVQIQFKQGDGTYGPTVDLGDGLASKSMVNAGYDTYSGNSYSGSASDYGLEIEKAEGNHHQETTNGYQLFDASKIATKSQGGAIITNNGDGSFTISGSGTLSNTFFENYIYSNDETKKILKKGTLMIEDVGNTNPQFMIGLVPSNGDTFISNKRLDKSHKSITITDDDLLSSRLRISFYGEINTTINGGTIKPTLYQDGDGTWERFTGGEPAPNPNYPLEPKFFEPKEIVSVGKNLFDINGNINSTVNGATEGNRNTAQNDILSSVTNIKSSRTTGVFFDNLKGKVVSIQAKVISLGTAAKGYLTLIEDGKISSRQTATQINSILKIENYLIKSDSVMIGFSGDSTTSGNLTSPVQFTDIMVNLGETSQDYVPFKGQDTTPVNIELRSLPNGVRDTYENGIVTRRVGKVVFDGSDDEKFIKIGTRFYINIPDISFAINGTNLICNRLIAKASLDKNTIYIFQKNIYIQINVVSAEEFKTWLQSNPIEVWYELEIPTTEYYSFPIIPSYFPYTNAWHDSEVEASDLTWNILARQYGSGQTTIKKDEAILTELDLNTERTATPTTVKVQLKDTSGNTFYVETSADNVYLKGTDGTEITQKNLNDKIGQLINLVAFYSANPTTVLADLKKYITTIS